MPSALEAWSLRAHHLFVGFKPPDPTAIIGSHKAIVVEVEIDPKRRSEALSFILTSLVC